MGYSAILRGQLSSAFHALPVVKAGASAAHLATSIVSSPVKALSGLFGGVSKAELRNRRLKRLREAVATGDRAVIENYAFGAHGGKGSRFGIVRRQAQAALESMKLPEPVALKANTTQAGFGGRAGSKRSTRRTARLTKRTARRGTKKTRGRLPAFGSPAWRKRFGLDKRRKRRRRR